MRTYIVCICSRTSQRPKALQDISNMLQIGCMPTEQLERLQLCTNAMSHSRGVLYNSFIDQFHLYKGTACHGPSHGGSYMDEGTFTLGSDCSLLLFQGTVLPLIPTLCILHCLLARVQCLMIWGCTSTSLPLLSIHICGPGGSTS